MPRKRRPLDASPYTILVVDDQEEILQSARLLLEADGHRVLTAASGAEALALLGRDTAHVALIDYFMPRMTGEELVARIRERDTAIQLILQTGYAGEKPPREMLRRLDIQGYHDKAEGPEKLLLWVDVALKARAQLESVTESERVKSALARVGGTLISSLDTPVLLEHLCEVTAEVLACDTSHTLLAPTDESVFTLAATHGLTTEEREVACILTVPRAGITPLLSRLIAEDVAEIEAGGVWTPWQRCLGATTALCLPLRRGDRIIGVQIAARRRHEAPFTATERRIARGITQLASMALANALAVEELEHANRLKSDFVATISHELRTPLNVMLGYNELLLNATFGPLNAEQTDALRRSDRSARGLLDLITATLDLSRLEAGRLPLDVRAVNPAELVATLDRETQERGTKPTVSFRSDVAPGLAPLHTDPTKLKIVLKNLIDNALKFTEQGDVVLAVTTLDGGVAFQVRDTGIGIAPEARAAIFEAFRQGDSSSTREHDGVGLGLYLVRRFLDLLGGTVEVESEVGRGSTFSVWLPQARSAA